MKKLSNVLLLLLAAKKAISEKVFSCEKSEIPGVDFACGESKPIPYQPCDSFELAYGEATTATQLWLLGEDHDRDAILNCVNLLTRNIDDHIIYLEGGKAGEKIRCNSYKGLTEKPGRVCKSWDDPVALREMTVYMEGSEEIEKNQKIRVQLGIFQKSYQADKAAGKSDRAFEKKLKEVKTALNSHAQIRAVKQHYSDKTLDIDSMLGAIDWLLAQRQKGESYEEAFATFRVYRPQGYVAKTKDVKKIKELRGKRDQALLETIHNHPRGQFGIFVVGKEHLTTGHVLADSSKAKELRNKLLELADENPFAVLTMPNI